MFVIERLLDFAAPELGIDLIEIRRRNLIPPDAFPWNNEIIFQDFTHLTYDSGNYEPVLDKAKAMIGWDAFAAGRRGRACGPTGKRVGHRAGRMYVEGTGIGPYEGARVQVEPTGKVTVVTGVGTQGQGHYTSFAQIAAEQLGVPLDDVLCLDRRHRAVQLGHGHVRQPGRDGGRLRRPRGGGDGAR